MVRPQESIRMRARLLYVARLRTSRLRTELHAPPSRALSFGTTGWTVDIGCGPGLLGARIAAEHPGARVLGVDLDPLMLAIAKDRDGARTVRATSENLPLRTGSVDIVVSSARLKDWGNRAGGL